MTKFSSSARKLSEPAADNMTASLLSLEKQTGLKPAEKQPPKPKTPDFRSAIREKPQREADSDWSILMARAQQGDSKAYRRLLKSIAPYLRSLAGYAFQDSRDVEDAVQDVLLTIHRQRHAYDPQRPFGPWLTTIARRRFIDRLRQLTKLKARETPLTPAHETLLTIPANFLEERVRFRELRRAIDELPETQAVAIRLLKLQDMSLKDASAVSNVSIGALKVATHRALKTLRRIFAERDH